MGVWFNLVLGLSFLVLALVNTLLMYRLWGYPYDKARHRSSAPRSLVVIHRATGYAFVIIYLFLVSEMLPRLWQYQIELPARSVMHLVLGFSIGIILIIKISIVRFFKHLESTLVPFLGTSAADLRHVVDRFVGAVRVQGTVPEPAGARHGVVGK